MYGAEEGALRHPSGRCPRKEPPASSFDSFISKAVCWFLKGRLSVCSRERESSGRPRLSLAAFMRNWTGLAWTFWYFNGFLRPDLTLLLQSHLICSDENWRNSETPEFVRFGRAQGSDQLPVWYNCLVEGWRGLGASFIWCDLCWPSARCTSALRTWIDKYKFTLWF